MHPVGMIDIIAGTIVCNIRTTIDVIVGFESIIACIIVSIIRIVVGMIGIILGMIVIVVCIMNIIVGVMGIEVYTFV